MSDAKYSRLKQLLDEQNEWPASYLFKFIVPATGLEKFYELVPNHQIKERPSRSGKFISVTFSDEFECSDQIISIYQKIAKIEGVIHL